LGLHFLDVVGIVVQDSFAVLDSSRRDLPHGLSSCHIQIHDRHEGGLAVKASMLHGDQQATSTIGNTGAGHHGQLGLGENASGTPPKFSGEFTEMSARIRSG
jgi:hypothetical protein